MTPQLVVVKARGEAPASTQAWKVPEDLPERFGRLVGRSPAMKTVFSLLQGAAATQATVLLTGETGTGKEAAAEAIHDASDRREGPFVVVDCGAIPPNLLESELFGHEKGSFTGASNRRAGAFEMAHGGTIFLDEIGELSADLQPKLLRVLERRAIKKVGGNEYIPVDVRVIAATHRHLRAESRARRFRSDLYYRLAVIEIELPALRDRPEDLPLLIEELVGGMKVGGSPAMEQLRDLSFLSSLAAHEWPGNVRELRNHIERCLALGTEVPLEKAPVEERAADDLRFDVSMPYREARDLCLAAFERRYLEEALSRSGGNVAAAARTARLDRVHFYRLLWRHGIR